MFISNRYDNMWLYISKRRTATVGAEVHHKGEDMDDHQYVPITKDLFKKHWRGSRRTVFIPQNEMGKRFRSAMEGIAKRNSELFLSEGFIITEKLSPLAEKEVCRIAKKHGYKAKCECGNKKLQYLGSNFGGHYSTDYYEILECSEIHVTLACSPPLMIK
jgi:hypothetical protein